MVPWEGVAILVPMHAPRLAPRAPRALALSACLLLGSACASINGPRAGRMFLPPTNPDAEAQFERILGLEGDWAWAPELGPELEGTVVTYRVTAAGSAVVETMFPGDPFEMVSVYHLDGSQLVMTHYGSAGNQPTMHAQPGSDDGPIHFDYIGATNLASVNTGHMHRMSYLAIDQDELLTSWTFFENQKSAGDRIFKLVRAGAAAADGDGTPPAKVDASLLDDLVEAPGVTPVELTEDLDAELEALMREVEADVEGEAALVEDLAALEVLTGSGSAGAEVDLEAEYAALLEEVEEDLTEGADLTQDAPLEEVAEPDAPADQDLPADSEPETPPEQPAPGDGEQPSEETSGEGEEPAEDPAPAPGEGTDGGR